MSSYTTISYTVRITQLEARVRELEERISKTKTILDMCRPDFKTDRETLLEMHQDGVHRAIMALIGEVQ